MSDTRPTRTRPTPFRLLQLLTALAVVLCVQTLGALASYGSSGPAPQPHDVVTFGTQTATATAPDGRGMYRFGATTGGLVDDYVAVINDSTQPVTFLVRAVDGVNTPQGGFAALPVNQPSKAVGTWISLPGWASSLTVGPRSLRIVPFTLRVPADTSPGDHFGVITATLVSSAQSKSGERIRLLQTVGTRVFVRVSGALHPGFSIENMRFRYTGNLEPIGSGRGLLTYTVTNTGNVALGGRQTVDVTGLFGSRSVARRVSGVQLLLPGFSVKETVPVSGIFPEFRDTAHVTISPLYIAGTVQPASGPYRADTAFWAVPWTLLAVVAFLALLVFLVFRLRRRRIGPRVGKGGSGRSGGPPTGVSWPNTDGGSHSDGGPAEPVPIRSTPSRTAGTLVKGDKR